MCQERSGLPLERIVGTGACCLSGYGRQSTLGCKEKLGILGVGNRPVCLGATRLIQFVSGIAILVPQSEIDPGLVRFPTRMVVISQKAIQE